MKKLFAHLVFVASLTGQFHSARAVILPVAEDTSSTAAGKINKTTGSAATLSVTTKQQAFVIFDLSTLPASVTASNIANARLNLYVSSLSNADNLTVHLVTNQWQENTASVPAPKYSSIVMSTIPAADLVAKRFIEVDVTAAVSNWFNGESNFGFAIATVAGNVRLASKEGLGIGFPALLEIETSVPAVQLNASQLTNGTLLLSSLPSAVVTNTETDVTLGGAFSGDGSGLTNLNAQVLTNGPINSNILNNANGYGLTNLNASQLTSGAVPQSDLPGFQASTGYATIGGGNSNTVSGTYSTVGGGNQNTSSGKGAFVGGGGYDGTTFSGNQATGNASTIGGGLGNTSSQEYATVGGGQNNISSQTYATVSGGIGNHATGVEAMVGGGTANTGSGLASTVGGGVLNIASGSFATVSGGWGNNSGIGAFIGGGGADGASFVGNSASGNASVVGGGMANTNNGNYSIIGGGATNSIQTNAYVSTIGGGDNNTIGTTSFYSTIGGGYNNIIQSNAPLSTIAGGVGNTIQSFADSTIGGGNGNLCETNAHYSTIGGGEQNNIQNNAYASTISGGEYNTIQSNAYESTIGGGGEGQGIVGNTIGTNSYDSIIAGGSANSIQPNAYYSTIGGGVSNSIQNNSYDSTIAGGNYNIIEINNTVSTIGGGHGNIIQTNASLSTIAGGELNIIQSNAYGSTIAGGQDNTIQSNAPYAAIPGGSNNLAAGQCSFAAGQNAQATNNSFVWGDGSAVTTAFANNQFMARASGGVVFLTDNEASPTSYATGTAGVALSANSTAWASVSDRNSKKNFQPVDAVAVLNKLAGIPIQQWNYKWEKDGDVPNIGPMAQDFKGAFYPGRDDKSITTLEFDGVELAAIQGLNQKLETETKEKDAEIEKLKANADKVDSLEKQLNELKQMVQSLAEKK